MYWTGQDFKYAHYLCVISILRTNKVQRCEVFYEDGPAGNKAWEGLKHLEGIKLIKLDYAGLFDKAGLDKEVFNGFFVEKLTPNQRSDLFRYLILWGQGGIYVDFDTLIIRDLEPLLDTEFFLGYQHYCGRYPLNGAVLGSIKESACIKLCLDEIARYCRDNTDFAWIAFGPGLLSALWSPKAFPAEWMLKLFDLFYRRGFHCERLLKLFNRLTQKRNMRYAIYPCAYFYPFSWPQWEEIFKADCSPLPRCTYALHFWNSKSEAALAAIGEDYIKNSDSVFAASVRKYILENAGEND